MSEAENTYSSEDISSGFKCWSIGQMSLIQQVHKLPETIDRLNVVELVCFLLFCDGIYDVDNAEEYHTCTGDEALLHYETVSSRFAETRFAEIKV